MKIIRTCQSCGAEQPHWMGGHHGECSDKDHKARWSSYFYLEYTLKRFARIG